MTLLAFQRDMRAWLTRDDAMAAARMGEAAAPGLRVYQNNYRAALVSCLEASFLQTLAWLGEAAFLRAAITHIDRLPPSSWTLDAYARDFPATLAALYPDDAEVGELAWLELALGEAFVGADACVLGVEELAGIDWDRAVLRTVPTLDMGDLKTNAAAIWSALADGAAVPAAAMLPEPGALLVWRQNQMSRFRAIDSFEAQALLRVRAGLSFAALCRNAVDAFGEDAGIERAGLWLGSWVRDGLIAAIGNDSGA